MKNMLLMFVRAYQLFLSPFLGTHCRFEPSCSCYAREALTAHGAIHGTILTLGRLLRCHPFTSAGYDPVPPTAHCQPPTAN